MKTILEASKKTPEISILEESASVIIKGRLIPEDPESIFSKISECIELVFSKNGKLTLDLELEYFNTSSARYLYDLLMDLKQKGNCNIIWRYEEDDEDILESGKELQEMTELDFEYDEL